MTKYYHFLKCKGNDIEHTKTKVRHPQTNGICERFHKTILHEFYEVVFRRKVYKTVVISKYAIAFGAVICTQK